MLKEINISIYKVYLNVFYIPYIITTYIKIIWMYNTNTSKETILRNIYIFI